MEHIQQINQNRKKIMISEIFAIAAMVLLLVDVFDTFIAQGRYGFIPVNDQQRGILVGVPSIILFLLSFAFGFRQKTGLSTSLLMAGGGVLAISKLVEPTLGLNLFLAVALHPLYIALIVMGFVIVVTNRIPKPSNRQHISCNNRNTRSAEIFQDKGNYSLRIRRDN